MVFGNFQQVASARLVQCGVHYVHVWMLFNLGIYLFSNISALKWRELFEKMLLRYGLNLEWSSSEWAENILAVAKSPIFSQPYTAVRQTASPVGCKTLLFSTFVWRLENSKPVSFLLDLSLWFTLNIWKWIECKISFRRLKLWYWMTNKKCI